MDAGIAFLLYGRSEIFVHTYTPQRSSFHSEILNPETHNPETHNPETHNAETHNAETHHPGNNIT